MGPLPPDKSADHVAVAVSGTRLEDALDGVRMVLQKVDGYSPATFGMTHIDQQASFQKALQEIQRRAVGAPPTVPLRWAGAPGELPPSFR